jgi:hypothetical protein
VTTFSDEKWDLEDEQSDSEDDQADGEQVGRRFKPTKIFYIYNKCIDIKAHILHSFTFCYFLSKIFTLKKTLSPRTHPTTYEFSATYIGTYNAGVVEG